MPHHFRSTGSSCLNKSDETDPFDAELYNETTFEYPYLTKSKPSLVLLPKEGKNVMTCQMIQVDGVWQSDIVRAF